MKNILRSKEKDKPKKLYKCYKCGMITDEKTDYCPKCIEDGFNIKMIDYH